VGGEVGGGEEERAGGLTVFSLIKFMVFLAGQGA